MPDSVTRAHAETIAQLRLLADLIAPGEVARAFVASLRARDLPARSALGSYALARAMPDHPLDPDPDAFATICRSCGWSRMPAGHEAMDEESRAHMRHERRRWGGVRHLQPEYALLDLHAFRALPPAEPSPGDWRTLELILRTPTLLAPEAKAADLERALKSVLPSNRDERGVLIRILAYAGVLEAPGHPSFLDAYVPPAARDLPPQRFADWGYPAIWWRAGHGVRADAITYWFPQIAAARAT